MWLVGLSKEVAKSARAEGLCSKGALGRGLGIIPLGIESGSNHKRDQKCRRHSYDASEEYEPLPLPLRKCPSFSDEVDPPDKKRKRDQKDKDILHMLYPIDGWVVPSSYNIMI